MFDKLPYLAEFEACFKGVAVDECVCLNGFCHKYTYKLEHEKQTVLLYQQKHKKVFFTIFEDVVLAEYRLRVYATLATNINTYTAVSINTITQQLY